MTDMKKTFLLFTMITLFASCNLQKDYSNDTLSIIDDIQKNQKAQLIRLEKYETLKDYETIHNITEKFIDYIDITMESVDFIIENNPDDYDNKIVEYFIIEQKASELKMKLLEFKQYNLQFHITEADKNKYRNYYDNILNLYDPKPQNGHMHTWESYTFEDISVNSVYCKLLLYQYLIRQIEIETLDYLMNNNAS
jgi:GldM N-terminal domain